MFWKWLISLLLPEPKKQRVGFMLVPYSAADALLQQGWTIAPEEDNNHVIGIVYLELLDKAN